MNVSDVHFCCSAPPSSSAILCNVCLILCLVVTLHRQTSAMIAGNLPAR